MDLFELALAKKLAGGGGGGGGGGDFSTANVTISPAGPILVLPGFWINEDDEMADSAVFLGESTHTAILYKGQQMLYFDDAPSAVSGAAEIVDKDVLVKGDCTITIT